MNSLIEVKEVNYKKILEYDNIKINENEITFIIGESGSGKSTFLKLLNGVESYEKGTIFYRGKNINDYDSLQLRRKLLLVNQSVYLFEGDIKDNFNVYRQYRELKPLTEQEMTNYLKICSIDKDLHTNTYSMSGGEKQRVFIAIVLSLDFEVLMLDEPTSALDEINSNILMTNIIKYIKDSHKNLLVISHDMTLARQYADNIIEIERGKHYE